MKNTFKKSLEVNIEPINRRKTEQKTEISTQQEKVEECQEEIKPWLEDDIEK